MSEDETRRHPGHEELVMECSECAELIELITDYLDNHETVEMRRALMAHAATCDHCARMLWAMRRVVATCRLETGSAVPVEVHAALWQVLVEEFRGERSTPDEE